MAKIELRNQNTIAKKVYFSGIALHHGTRAKIALCPAQPDSGIVFYSGNGKLPANLNYALYTNNMTCLHNNSNYVYCIEHLMAVLASMKIDNCMAELSGSPEMPWGDGSGMPYVKLIKKAGIKKQNEKCYGFILDKTISVSNGDRSITARPLIGAKNPVIKCAIDFDNIVGKQKFRYVATQTNFTNQIANARSFFSSKLTYEEITARFPGYSKDNVIAYDEKGFLTKLRYKDECVRHKILDFIGDFALLGKPVIAEFLLVKPGHQLHLDFARKCRNLYKLL